MKSRTRFARLSSRLRRIDRDRRVLQPGIEIFEPRVLLATGPLQITITEVETGQSVTLTDNIANDTDPSTGSVNYSTPIVSPFDDFAISNFTAVSNRTTLASYSQLQQGGTIYRTTATAGARTLTISVGDTGFVHPVQPTTLTSSATATFTNSTSFDSTSFQSTVGYNNTTTSSSVVTLAPDLMFNPESKGGTSPDTTLTAVGSPFDLANTFIVKLGPSTVGSAPSTVSYQDNGTTQVTGNNPLTVSGTVFSDLNHDDLLNQPGEMGLGGVQVTLTGTDVLGNPVNLTTNTLADGTYSFLVPYRSNPNGYTITERATPGYLHEDEIPGTTGKIAQGPRTLTIILPPLTNSYNNNFSEELPASVSGYVYYDKNNDGTFQATESPIPGTYVTLTGTSTDFGAIAPVTVQTNANGYYFFGGLRRGNYTVTETQPTDYLDGKDTVGTGATFNGPAANDQFVVGLTAGNAGVNYNFGEIKAGSLAGVVYYDKDDSGTVTNGDVYLQGVTIALTDSGGNLVATTMTLADGSYKFTGLAPGTYTITETQPAGYLQGTDTVGSLGGSAIVQVAGTDNSRGSDTDAGIVLTGGANGINYNFGEILPAKLSGFVYYDSNNNGLHSDDTANGIVGVTVKLSGTNDLGASVAATIMTAADGSYSFTGLRPGTYTVTETQPATNLDGLDAKNNVVITGSVGTDTVSGITLTPGSSAVNNNFGELLPSKLSGFVYYDVNNNGVKEAGEVGIPNTTVTLTGTNDLGAIAAVSMFTGSDGSYAFGNLRPGTYVLSETQPSGYLDGIDTIGSQGGTTANDKFSNIVLGQNANGVNNNFGEIKPIAITGTVFLDKTGNGLSSDDSIFTPSSVEVDLYTDTNKNGSLDSGDAIVSVYNTSTGLGTFSFTTENKVAGNPALPLGTYFVQQIVPSGYIQTAPTPTPYYTVLATTPGTSYDHNDFDNFKTCDCTDYGDYYTINDCSTHYTDLRGNVHQGDVVTAHFKIAGPGSSTLTLVSYVAPGSSFDANAASQQSIFALATGTFAPSSNYYTLTVKVPDSYFQVDFVCGTAIDRFSPAGGNVFYSAQGRLISADNGGTIAAGFLAGYVYYDANDNGTRSNESGINNVTVTLYRASAPNTPYRTTTTNTSGYYQFTNLPADTYTLVETQPLGYLDGTDAVGTAGGSSAVNDTFSGINLTRVSPGYVMGTDYNFGEVTAAVISGYAYLDDNDNCNKDSGETGISGVTLTLSGTDDHGAKVSNKTTLTGSDGSYSFNGLRPGTYTVTETQPNGYTTTGNTVGSAGGNLVNSPEGIKGIILGSNGNGSGYNFGEIKFSTTTICNPVSKCDAASINFWAGSSGQCLIKSLNGGGSSGSARSLGTVLATQLPNLFSSLNGATNATVASYFLGLKNNSNSVKGEAQVMAVALAYYAGSTYLAGGNYAAPYINTSYYGPLSGETVSIGSSDASALGVASGNYTILTFLKIATFDAVNGMFPTSAIRNAANSVADDINNA